MFVQGYRVSSLWIHGLVLKVKKKSHHFVVSALYFIHIQKHYVSVQQHYPVTKVTMFYDDVWENSMPHL